MTEGIYLLHSMFSNGDCIYKIGQSKTLDRRLKEYPPNYSVVVKLPCKNSGIIESAVIREFNTNPNLKKCDRGKEHFQSKTLIDDVLKKIVCDIYDKYAIKVKCSQQDIKDVRSTENIKGKQEINQPIDRKEIKIVSPVKQGMERLHAFFLILSYNQHIPTKKIHKQFEKNEGVFVFMDDTITNVLLYKKNSFDIKTEMYIIKHFVIGGISPEVRSISKHDIIRTLQANTCIYSRGFLKELGDKHSSREVNMNIKKIKQTIKAQHKKIATLEKELTKKNGDTYVITNVMIP